MPLVIAGATSGQTTLQATDAVTAVITLPSASGIVVVSASGQVDLTTAVSGTLPVANGGTGVTSAGANGNILTSNGTAWVSSTPASGGVTSLNGQTGAITDTTYGSIGSYVIAATNVSGTTAYANNTTVAGSILVNTTGTTIAPFTSSATTGFSNAGLSGTWRNVGGRIPSGTNIGASTYSIPSLWVRIS